MFDHMLYAKNCGATPTFMENYLCARSLPIKSRVQNSKFLAQVVLDIDVAVVDVTLNDL